MEVIEKLVGIQGREGEDRRHALSASTLPAIAVGFSLAQVSVMVSAEVSAQTKISRVNKSTQVLTKTARKAKQGTMHPALVAQLANTEVTNSQQKINTTVQAAAEVNKSVISGNNNPCPHPNLDENV